MDDEQKKQDQPEDVPPPAALTKEQLRGLLNSFLDQLIASKPPASPIVDEHQNPDQEEEPVPKVREIPSPADLFRAWQQGGREKLGELMKGMDGADEDDTLPEWNERRSR